MKKSNNILLIAGALTAGYLLLRKRNASGVGATKRRIWKEVAQAQEAGIDLSDPTGYEGNEALLRRMANGKLTASNSAKPDEQRYFNQLRRAYRSIAGTSLPSDDYVVRNENGDVILMYRDYHLDELPEKAAKWILSNNEYLYMSEDNAYWCTIADIALGNVKFVWSSKGAHRGVQDLVFGASAPSERKQRISYLASPEKGGVYPEMYAHYLWETASQGTGDSQEITNGVLQAIRECTSVGDAQKMCTAQYVQRYQVQEPALYQDVPF